MTWHDGYQVRFQIPPDLVKLTRPISLGVLPGVVTTLTLDFDVARTFRQAEERFTTDCAALKEAGRITFSPAVRAISHGSLRMVNGIVTDGRTGQGFPLVTVTGEAGGAERSALTGDGSGGEPVGFYVLFLENRVTTLTFESADGRSRTVTVQPGERGTFESVNVTIP